MKSERQMRNVMERLAQLEDKPLDVDLRLIQFELAGYLQNSNRHVHGEIKAELRSFGLECIVSLILQQLVEEIMGFLIVNVGKAEFLNRLQGKQRAGLFDGHNVHA
ncbi:hypothetical protein D3C73_1259510 [compost metagenome]